MVVTVRQHSTASGTDARLDEEGCGNSGMKDQVGGETRLFGQIGMALHGGCKLLCQALTLDLSPSLSQISRMDAPLSYSLPAGFVTDGDS